MTFDLSWIGLADANPEIAFWTIAIGVLCNVSCAILGCFLVLRRMSLLGDAISHAILPGLVVAYLLTGKTAMLPMFLGAMTLGMLTAALTQTLANYTAVPEDSSMGVVFSAFFAIGVVLIQVFARNLDLDPDCVLYGDIVLASVDYAPLWGLGEAPRAIRPLAVALVMTIGFVALFWKELKIVSFDPALAAAMGLSPLIVHYLLMAMVAGATVTAFEAVGSILVIAMLIIPAATAQLLSDRLTTMLAWAVAVAIVSALGGYWFAHRWETSVAGMMAVSAAFQFTIALMFAPKHGMIGRAANRLAIALRITREDLLALLYRSEEQGKPSRPRAFCRKAIGDGWLPRLAIPWLERRGQIAIEGDGEIRLTDEGRAFAQSLVRTHRLWESYLEEHFELPLDHLHESAERVEHYIGPELQRELAEELQKPRLDPHGRRIP